MKLPHNESFDIERIDAKRWPVAETRYVFLADALERVGRTKFGVAWDATESLPTTENEQDFEAWEVRSDNLEKLEQQRVDEVAATIASWARAGELITAARAKLGGATQDLPPALWNFENWRIRFRRYDISLLEPFSARRGGSHYLYVRQPSLLRCLVRFGKDADVESRASNLVWEIVEGCLEMWEGPPPPAMPQAVVREKMVDWLGTRGLKLKSSNEASASLSSIERALKKLRELSDGN
jgi:hypothetical protein